MPPLSSVVSQPAYQLRMNSLHLLFVAASLMLPLCAANASAPSADEEELEQVHVYGSKEDLWQLRQAIIEAENRFYERYNELNSNDDFDVKCRVEARTGTRLTTRTCRPLYQEDAVQEGAKQAVELRQGFQSYRGEALLGATSPPVPAAIKILARRPEFERNMRNVVRKHPELTALLRERAAAATALEAATRRDRPDHNPSAH